MFTERDIGKAIYKWMPKWIDPITGKEGPKEKWIYLIADYNKKKGWLLRNPRTGNEWYTKNLTDWKELQ